MIPPLCKGRQGGVEIDKWGRHPDATDTTRQSTKFEQEAFTSFGDDKSGKTVVVQTSSQTVFRS